MKYLIPFDFSSVSENAVLNAIQLASISKGTLVFVHIVSERDEILKKELKLKEYVAKLTLPAGVNTETTVVAGDVFEDIGKIADAQKANWVIMGTHGVDFKQRIFGSNSVKVISNSSVPFIIMQEGVQLKEIKHIILPYSIENKSLQVLRFAAQLCKTFSAKLTLIGRHHDDEFLKHKEHNSIIMAKKHLLEVGVEHQFELSSISKSDFPDFIVRYAKEHDADLIASTYFSDSIMPMFEKFVQNLIVNEAHIPVVCINAQSLSKADSVLSFMTN